MQTYTEIFYLFMKINSKVSCILDLVSVYDPGACT